MHGMILYNKLSSPNSNRSIESSTRFCLCLIYPVRQEAKDNGDQDFLTLFGRAVLTIVEYLAASLSSIH
jgi:hypothetical protein